MPRCGPARATDAPLVACRPLRRRRSARRRSASSGATHEVNDRSPPVTSPTCPPPRPTAWTWSRCATTCGRWRATTRPRSTSRIRLNTNESPFPPPPGWREELAGALARSSGTATPTGAPPALRGGDRRLARRRPRRRCSPPTASNEVLQTLLLTYAGPGRSVLTFEPTYQLHAHIARITGADGGRGRAGRRLPLDARRGAPPPSPTRRPAVTFLCSPNNPTGPGRGRRRSCDAAAATWRRRPGRGRRGLRPVRRLDRARPASPRTAPLVVVRTFSKTWSMAAARLGYLVGPSWLVRHLEGRRAAVPPRRRQADRRPARPRATSTRWTSASRSIVAERERLVDGLAALPVEVFPSGANFVLFRVACERRGRDVWQGLVDRSVLVRDCSGWPRLDGCLRRHHRHAGRRTTGFLAALGEVLA